MADEQVFRFMALRQPAAKPTTDTPGRKAIGYSVTGAEPPLAREILKLPVAERTPQLLKRIAQRFQADKRYVQDLAALPFDLAPLAAWAEQYSAQPLSTLDLPGFIESSYGKPAAEIIASPAFGEAAVRLAETLLADVLADANRARRRDDIVHAIKLMFLAYASVKQPALFSATEPLGELVARLVVTLLELQRAEPDAPQPSVTPGKDPRADDERTAGLRARLSQLTAAHAELVDLLARPTALHTARAKVTRPVAAGAQRIEALEAQLTRLALRVERPDAAPATEASAPRVALAAAAGLLQAKPKTTLAFRAIEALSPTTAKLLAELTIDPRSDNPYAAVTTLEAQIAHVSAELPVPATARKLVALGGVLIDADRFAEAYGRWAGTLDVGALAPHRACEFKAGIGDLLIVRQKLKAYELGDFAHVENVLIGETRSREHRRLSLREEISTTETERESEKERNLQSTERNEMQNEASKTVQSQFQLDAGLQVSGSYGPAVSFSASLNTSFSTSTEESQRKAVSYSREVAEKTSERLRERVREEQRRRVLEQVEEINLHKLENTQNPTGHVRGIYRWLNKIYDAQVFNYGQRMMYEFVLPEPAAYFLYAMVENPPGDAEIEKPEPPMFGSVPLKPENLTRTNYQQYLAKYEVTNAKAPPSSFKNVAFFEKQEGKEESNYERASKLTITEGYEATSATAWWSYWRYDDNADRASLAVTVGGHDATSGWVAFGSAYRDEISVGVFTSYNAAFVVTVDVTCRLTAEGFAKWQHEVYDAILEAYLNKRAAYEEKLAQLAIQKGVQILGRNPFENQRIAREELTKLVLMMLMGSSYLDINSFYGGGEPFMNIAKACANGATIRFFENAFEWNNMTYVFYPYFWGRHARWLAALHLTDPDPDFAAFLRAGAARVQVPVRPGFERAVAYFCQTGEIWEGNDVPLIGDSTYVPIVQEITENLGKLDAGVPYPPGSQPWEVTVPTSLVIVQDLDEIPQIRDTLTGNPIKLVPDNA